MDTPSLPSQFEYLAVSTPLLASQNQPLYDYDLSGTTTVTPTIPSTSSLDGTPTYGYPPFSSSQNPLFSSPPPSAPVPHFSSSGTATDHNNNEGGAFSPTSQHNMPNYFTHQHQPQQQQHPAYPQHHRHAQYFDSNLIITPGGSLSSPEENSGMFAQDQSGMFMDATMQGQDESTLNRNSSTTNWDTYPTTNATPTLETLIEQQLHMDTTLSPGPHYAHIPNQQFYQLQSQEIQQQQQQQQMQSPPMIGSMTPPQTPHPPHRLFHSQSQPGLRALQQQQQKQQLQQQQTQQQQQNLRRRQHSVHFPSEFLSGDLGNLRPNRHVSLPVGSYSAPVPSLASLSELMRESNGNTSSELVTTTAATMAETATLLSMSLPSSGFSFLNSPPPPMLHHHHSHMHFEPSGMHQHFLPTSPPLTSSSLTDISGASTPVTNKSRSRAGSKSRSRPTSASSIATVRNASAPYSPSISSNAVGSTTPVAASTSRSPSLIPLSPIPPFRLGSANMTDSDLGPPPKPAYETGLIVLPSSLGAATAGSPGATGTAAATGTGGKAKRISRTKVPGTKARSRSSTISTLTSPSAAGTPSEATAVLMNSPFSLVLSEQDEKTLQGLADQAAASGNSAMNSSELHFVPPPPSLQHHSAPIVLSSQNGDVDPFQLEASVQLHQHLPHHHHHHSHQQHPLDPNMFELSLMSDLEEGSDLDEDGEGGDLDDDTLTNNNNNPNANLTNSDALMTPTTSNSSSSSSPAPSTSSTTGSITPGKPIPCPFPSCPKSFTRPFNLNAHVKSHDTLKPYACHVCPRVFSRKHDLQRHIRVHTGSKPYVCMCCQKAFARTDALCRHYKVEEPCRLMMEQDGDIKKQAQQQVQQQLHQEQIELQQAQQAHAEAQALQMQQQQQQQHLQEQSAMVEDEPSES
ncbi:hypothetical protein BGZ83_003889 [Gryganskiella cystojenkinii]|nr:hypothetical protein BGZ83_003889 [Gryganskiella cystojenkinii]